MCITGSTAVILKMKISNYCYIFFEFSFRTIVQITLLMYAICSNKIISITGVESN